MGSKKSRRISKEKRVIESLDNETVLEQLLEMAQQLDVNVRQEVGDFKAGSCRLEDEIVLFLKKTDPDVAKIDLLVRELAPLQSDHIKIDPTVRFYLKQSVEPYNVAVK